MAFPRRLPAERALACVLVACAFTQARPAAALAEREPDARAAATCAAIPAPNCLPAALGPFLDGFANGVAVVTGELGPEDSDFFALELSAGQLLLVSLFDERGGEMTDTRIGVFSEALSASDGTLVADNDDGGPGFLSRLAVPVAQGGTWKVAVTGYGDDEFQGAHLQGRGEPSRYTLVLAVATDPADGVELDSDANDSLVGAQLLPEGGGVVRGTLESPAAAVRDRDHFAIDVADGDEITASLFDLAPGALASANGALHDSVIAVFDASGAPLAGGANDDGGPGYLSNVRVVVPAGGAGTWKVGVSGYGDDTGATGFGGSHVVGPFDYELVVAAAAAVLPPSPRCDANADAFVDRSDINLVLLALGQAATGPSDPRDADGDLAITIRDARACTLRCGRTNCEPRPQPACGLGAELVVLLGIARLVRSRRRRSRHMRRWMLLLVAATAVAAPRPSAALSIALVPADVVVPAGETFAVDVVVSDLGTALLGGFDIDLAFDDAQLDFVSGSYGSFLGDLQLFEALALPAQASGGIVKLVEVSFLSEPDLAALQPDSFLIATIAFRAAAEGESALTLSRVDPSDGAGGPLPILSLAGARVAVVPPIPEPTGAALFTLGAALVAAAGRRRSRSRTAC